MVLGGNWLTKTSPIRLRRPYVKLVKYWNSYLRWWWWFLEQRTVRCWTLEVRRTHTVRRPLHELRQSTQERCKIVHSCRTSACWPANQPPALVGCLQQTAPVGRSSARCDACWSPDLRRCPRSVWRRSAARLHGTYGNDVASSSTHSRQSSTDICVVICTFLIPTYYTNYKSQTALRNYYPWVTPIIRHLSVVIGHIFVLKFFLRTHIIDQKRIRVTKVTNVTARPLLQS